MSPTMHMQTPPMGFCTPKVDTIDRHEFGVSKSLKTTSTGGGRAWSEEEENYLVQTRLQKMPYKHIAAHLKKTELACRLHFHQLTHGSNRRRRTTSVSSGSSAGEGGNGYSPLLLAAAMPSPIMESLSRPTSPQEAAALGIAQLPAIMQAAEAAAAAGHSSTGLPVILPKPAAPRQGPSLRNTPSPPLPAQKRGYPPTPVAETVTLPGTTSASLPPPPPPRGSTAQNKTTCPQPSLRLDCSGLPPPPSAGPGRHLVDMSRLQAVYAAHRTTIWATIAADYGGGASPHVLEQAWRDSNSGSCSERPIPHLVQQQQQQAPQQNNDAHWPYQPSPPLYQQQIVTPITPSGSSSPSGAGLVEGVGESSYRQQQQQQDRTRISAILGLDADPRSPQEREMVRRLEQGMGSAAASAAPAAAAVVG